MKKKYVVTSTQSHFQKKPPNKKRLLLFKVITILLPFVLLALTEGILRLWGYGKDMHLFKEHSQDSTRYWVMNQDVTLKYFTKEENATRGFSDLFRKEKTPETFRIFILGGSTGVGDPYTQLISCGRWLQYRLMHTFPEINLEMINLSLTAVNSYTVLDFTGEIVKYEPDVVLIYAGHNEYYGALGVGSTSKLGNNVYLVRTLMELRKLRLIQLINNALNKLTNGNKDQNTSSDPGLMQKMAADNEIPYLSKKFNNGLKQFEANMNDACKLLSKKKIPVFISNLVSNEKDLEPFVSDSGSVERSASHQYDLAKQAYSEGDFELAKQLFIRAKDLDMLRFRAPEEINNIIVKIAGSYPGVYLVDTESLFQAHSPYGIIGKETIIDHLHPNILGYALMSEAFYQAMKEQKIIMLENRQEISFEQLISQMPVTKIDSLKGLYANQYLLQRWPFNEEENTEIFPENSIEGQLAYEVTYGEKNWFNAVNELAQHYIETNNWKEAFRLGAALALVYPYVTNAFMSAYEMSMMLEDFNEAVFYLGKAYQLEPDQEKAESMFRLLVETDQPELALPYLDYLINNTRQGANYLPSKTFVNEVIGFKTNLDKDSSNIDMLNQIANSYLKLGSHKISLKYIEKALSLDRDNEYSLDILDRIESFE